MIPGLLEPLAGRVSSSARRQQAGLRVHRHRPFPLPEGRWVMGQTWDRLLFAHWTLDPRALRRVVPPVVELDLFEGRAWIGITPFLVRGLRASGTPPPPVLSGFPELNVRTYVVAEGRPGIWFLSLDAGSRLAVAAARLTYRLPYFPARMRVRCDGNAVAYQSARTLGGAAAFGARYEPAGPGFEAEPGTLEHWLAERYRVYTVDRRGLLWADIHHPPWPLQPARAVIERNTMTDPHGIRLEGKPHLMYAERQDVLFWPPVRDVRGDPG